MLPEGRFGLAVLERERKFYYSLLVFLILVGMRLGDVISEGAFVDFGQVAFIAYMAGNAAEHFAKRKPEADK